MKQLLLLTLAVALAFAITGCDDDDSNPTGGPGSGSTLSAEGFDLTYTISGQETKESTDELFNENFNGARNIAGFFKLITLYTENGTLFFRTHYGQEYDKEKSWQDDMVQDHGLYPYQYLQQWTPELVGTASTLTFVGGDYAGEYFGGNVSIERDKSIGGTTYSLYGEIDASGDGGMKIEGSFWAKEFDWND